MRLLCGIIMGVAFYWAVHTRADSEEESDISRKGQKYVPYVAGYLLPSFLIMLFLFGWLFLGSNDTSQYILSMCFTLFLHISVYYAILLPMLPYLRKQISARACAMLWLIPNYLYLVQRDSMAVAAPLLVITTPGKLVWILLWIWFAGFVGFLVWKIASHIQFRRQLLFSAEIHPDLKIRQRWKQELIQARFKDTDIPLMLCPQITTPVTVGLFRSSIIVILPKKNYNEEELKLIFQHEIVHIGREDTWSKFFLMFCTAMCWFNPLMWMAMARSAEDLELSCDETVLLNASDETRKLYAGLLLNTAGDSRGFTTCLSASAEALRYRLKNVIKPVPRASGAALVGVAFLLLTMTYGYVALAYDGTAGSEILYQSDDHSDYAMTVLSSDLPVYENDLKKADEDGILQYISGLTMYRITGQYHFKTSTREALLELSVPQSTDYWLFLYDHAIELYPLSNLDSQPVCYYIPEGIDWNLVDQLIATSSR